MATQIKNSGTKSEEKYNSSQSNSTSPNTEESKQSSLENNEQMVVLPSGRKFSQRRYNQLKTALNLSGTLRLPDDIKDDGIYSYFWASTQFEGQISKKQSLGYEICKDKNAKEYRQFAGMDGAKRHDHILMKIKKEDREIISAIQRERKQAIEMDRITKNLDEKSVFENVSRLQRDGEIPLEESIQNKYNSKKIKQI